jgi:hypothetical protein
MASLEAVDRLRAAQRDPTGAIAAGQRYEPIDAVKETMRATAVMGGMGVLFSSVQNSLARQNIGWTGIFTRTGGTMVTFGAYLSDDASRALEKLTACFVLCPQLP